MKVRVCFGKLVIGGMAIGTTAEAGRPAPKTRSRPEPSLPISPIVQAKKPWHSPLCLRFLAYSLVEI